MRSIDTFRSPIRGIVNRSAPAIRKISSGMFWTAPVWPMIPPMKTTAPKAPSMKMSPWAKLISSMIP
jgi:hypothetical protein